MCLCEYMTNMNVAVWGEAGGGVMQLQQDECCDGTHECNDDQELFQLVILKQCYFHIHSLVFIVMCDCTA